MKSFDPKSAIIGVLACALVFSFFSTMPTYPEHIVCKSLTVHDDKAESIISLTAGFGGPIMQLIDKVGDNRIRFTTNTMGNEVALIEDGVVSVALSSYDFPRLQLFTDGELKTIIAATEERGGSILLLHDNNETSCYLGQISSFSGGWETYNRYGKQIAQSPLH